MRAERAAALARALVADARASGQRRALRVAGTVDETREMAAAALAAAGIADALWVGDAPDGARQVAPGRARAVLGQEAGAVVFDLHGGIDPDAIGAASGVVAGGGLWILRSPAGLWGGGCGDRARLAMHPHGADAVGERFPALFAAAWAGVPVAG
ncbi:MAG: tRNA(Met) cytidine acetyltransferase TmcA domain-containing protein [bacterium]